MKTVPVLHRVRTERDGGPAGLIMNGEPCNRNNPLGLRGADRDEIKQELGRRRRLHGDAAP